MVDTRSDFFKKTGVNNFCSKRNCFLIYILFILIYFKCVHFTVFSTINLLPSGTCIHGNSRILKKLDAPFGKRK